MLLMALSLLFHLLISNMSLPYDFQEIINLDIQFFCPKTVGLHRYVPYVVSENSQLQLKCSSVL